MSLNSAMVFFADAAPAGTEVSNTGQSLRFFMLMGLMLVVMYVITIRPQQKKQKEHLELLKTLRPNDKILTTSGIVGVVISVKDTTVTIRSADTKLEVTKSAIGSVTERSADSKESKES